MNVISVFRSCHEILNMQVVAEFAKAFTLTFSLNELMIGLLDTAAGGRSAVAR